MSRVNKCAKPAASNGTNLCQKLDSHVKVQNELLLDFSLLKVKYLFTDCAAKRFPNPEVMFQDFLNDIISRIQ